MNSIETQMTEFTQEIFDDICSEISKGRSLRSIVEGDKSYPSRAAFYKWLDADQTLVDQYVRAKQECADHYAEEIVEIADKSTDWQKDRLRIDARKWVASKLKPKAYGEKLDLSSSDGTMTPTKIELVVVDPTPNTDA